MVSSSSSLCRWVCLTTTSMPGHRAGLLTPQYDILRLIGEHRRTNPFICVALCSVLDPHHSTLPAPFAPFGFHSTHITWLVWWFSLALAPGSASWHPWLHGVELGISLLYHSIIFIFAAPTKLAATPPPTPSFFSSAQCACQIVVTKWLEVGRRELSERQ